MLTMVNLWNGSRFGQLGPRESRELLLWCCGALSRHTTMTQNQQPEISSYQDSDPRFDADRLKEEEYIYDLEEYHFSKAKQMSNCASIIFSIIKNVGLKKGASLTSIACPAALLKRFSLLEMYSYTSQPKSYLEGLEKMTAEQRIINIAKWWVENQMILVQTGCQDVKPFNPILGEQFHATFQHPNSETTYVAEQVSHHPPITAIYMENKKEGFTFEQTHQPKSTFWGNSAYSVIEGNNVFSLPRLGETYSITNPDINLRNLLLGTTYLNQEGSTQIVCEKTGYMAEFTFKKKFCVSGYIAKLEEEGSKPQKLYEVDGKMDKEVKWRRVGESKYTPFLDASKVKSLPRKVNPVYKQQKNESRRVWHGCAFGLYHRNFDEALDHKNKVEEFQRKLRKDDDSNHENWKPALFDQSETMLGQSTPLYVYKNRFTGQE